MRIAHGATRWAALVALLTALALVLSPSGILLAQDSGPSPWERTALTAPVTRLHTPTSGALFARTASGLARSDDGGTTWADVSLPAAPRNVPGAIVVDPNSHATIYLAAADGVYKTEDDAASWRLILSTPPDERWVLALAVSPAESSLVYLALAGPHDNQFHFLRSHDGGASWNTLDDQDTYSMFRCTWMVPLLQAHPTEVNRVWRAAMCRTNADLAELTSSDDQGTTWTVAYTPRLAIPYWLASTPARPGQLLLGVQKDNRGGGSLVAVSDDDGTTWRTVLEYTGGGGMSGGGPDVTLGGLALDPTRPDRLLVGLNQRHGAQDLPVLLRVSADAGATWTDTAPPDLGKVRDVVFGIDGRLAFAATDTGVWRAHLP